MMQYAVRLAGAFTLAAMAGCAGHGPESVAADVSGYAADGSVSRASSRSPGPAGAEVAPGLREVPVFPDAPRFPAPPGTGSCQPQASGVFAFRQEFSEQHWLLTIGEPDADLRFSSIARACPHGERIEATGEWTCLDPGCELTLPDPALPFGALRAATLNADCSGASDGNQRLRAVRLGNVSDTFTCAQTSRALASLW